MSNPRVYFGNLSWQTNDDDLADYAAKCGRVKSAEVILQNNRSRGFGIVEYDSPEDAAAAITELNDIEFMGRAVCVREDSRDATRPKKEFEPPKHSTTESARLFVGNLPFRTAWQDLKDMFRDVQGLIRADIMQDHDGRSKGCGVVVYDTIDAAQEAIDKFNGIEIDGRVIAVREDAHTQKDYAAPRPRYEDRGYDRRSTRDSYERYDDRPSYNSGGSYGRRPSPSYRDERPSYRDDRRPVRRRSYSRSPSPYNRRRSVSPVSRRSVSPPRGRSPVRRVDAGRASEGDRGGNADDDDVNLYD